MKKAENSQKAEIRIYSTQHDISEERVENTASLPEPMLSPMKNFSKTKAISQ